MEKSESIIEFSKALIKLQGGLKPAVRDKVNPFLNTNYADLAAIMDVCQIPLFENKFCISHLTNIGPYGPYLETVLIHESGEWMTSKYPLQPSKPDDPQSMGSALAYARRYNLSAMLNIVTEDDDAERAMGRLPANNQKIKTRTVEQQYPKVFNKKPVTREQLAQLEGFKKAGKNIKSIVDVYHWNVAKLSNLTFEQAETLIKELTKEVAK